MTQKDVAHLSGVKRPTYALIETGAREPSVPTAKKLSKVLGIEWTRFFEEQQRGA